MAYTQSMDETTPSGAAAANTADDQLRALKRDIKERFNSFCADWNTDPCAPDVLATGVVVPASFTITAPHGFVDPMRLIQADVEGGVSRIVFGKGGTTLNWLPSVGGGNIAWPCIPIAGILAGEFPAATARMNGLIGIDPGFPRLVFYATGIRYYISVDGMF